jgi:hypothetical protein
MAEKKLNPYFMPAGVKAYKDGKPITSAQLELEQRKLNKQDEKPYGKKNPILEELGSKIRDKSDKPKMFKGGILNRTYGMKEGGFTKRGGMYKKGYIYSDD